MKPEWVNFITNSSVGYIAWIFSPGHAGVDGNERADTLARTADISPEYTMGEVEVLSSLAQLDDSDNDSDKVCRLRDLEISAGSGRACNKRGRARNIMNQTALGTVSQLTLPYLPGIFAECLWAFPQYDAANSS